MWEFLQGLEAYELIILLVALGSFLGMFAPAVSRLAEARAERLADEQDHRQTLERKRQRHEQRLLEMEKLKDALSIAIADREMAGLIRDEIDVHVPRVRVEEMDAEEDESRRRKTRRKR